MNWDKINGIFERCFYDTSVTFYEKSIKGSYNAVTTKKVHCIVNADVQPYNGALDRREYGLSIDEGLKVFCPNVPPSVLIGDSVPIGQEILSAGLWAEINGIEYLAKYAEAWNSGTVIVLERCRHD